MEPKLPSPEYRAEIPSTTPETSIESNPDIPSIELDGHNRTIEREPIAQSSSSQSDDTAQIYATASPVVSQPIADDATSAASLSNVPAVASDDDLIEKEWVDRAKKVISTTKDDPYRREKEVGELQADYLIKRYGRSLGRD